MVQDAPEYVSARQRARNNVSGANVARVLRGQAPAHEKDEVQPSTGRRHNAGPHDNYSSPREFFAGPHQPPRMSSGIRRNPEANRDTVGLMLTDEYLMMNSGVNRGGQFRDQSEAYGAPARRGQGASRMRNARSLHAQANKSTHHNGARAPNGYRDGLTNNCLVTAPEKQWRSGVKITHPQGGMDAPYFEDTDPRPPRDAPHITGKRHVRPPHKDAKMFGQVPPPKEGEEDLAIQSCLPPCRKSSNKANESVDVLNLYCYSAEELNEKPQPYKQLGPRKYVAPDMPPRRQPMIHPINTPAKQEHDVLGTGRWGVPEKQHPRGVARGSCRPPRDTANLFRGGVAPDDESPARPRGPYNPQVHGPRSPRQVEPFRVNVRVGNSSPKKRPDPVFTDADRPRKILSKRNAGSADLLRYYDPNLDPRPAPSPTKRGGQRANVETRELDPSEIKPTCKGRGEFANNGRSSIVMTYAS